MKPHIKHQGLRPFGFRHEDLFMLSCHISLCKICSTSAETFRPLKHYVNKVGKGSVR